MAHRARQTIAAAAVLAAMTAGGGAAGAVSAAAGKPIAWRACTDAELRKADVQCAAVRVPLDHTRPDGPAIEIAVARHKASVPAARRLGVLVGESLYSAVPDPAGLGKAIAAGYDLVGIDPRGVGESRPRLNCGGPDPFRAPQPAYQPATGPDEAPGANERAWLRRWGRFRERCVDKYGDRLRHYTVEASARDVEAVRKALRADTLNLYSGYFNQGLTPQAYASLFPNRVHRMVLHAPYSAQSAGYDAVFRSAAVEGQHVEKFWGWVAEHHNVYGLGESAGEIRARFETVERQLTRAPLPRFGPAEWSDSIPLAAVYEENNWPEIASAFAKWVRGNRKPLLERYSQPDPDVVAGVSAYAANTCSAGTWPADYRRWRADAFTASQADPTLAWSIAMGSFLACRNWPVQGQLPHLGAAGPDLLLVVPAADTGFLRDTLTARTLFPGASVLAVRDSVTNPEFSGNPCVDRAVRSFLLTGDKPARQPGEGPDDTCGPPQLPKPLRADIKAAGNRDAGSVARGGDGGVGGDGGADGTDGGTNEPGPPTRYLFATLGRWR